MRHYNLFSEIPLEFSGTCEVSYWKCYIKNGLRHREDGPALEPLNGTNTTEWWYEGDLHRLDGPAGMFTTIKEVEFYIYHEHIMLESEFWAHPLVLKHKLKKILNTVI